MVKRNRAQSTPWLTHPNPIQFIYCSELLQIFISARRRTVDSGTFTTICWCRRYPAILIIHHIGLLISFAVAKFVEYIIKLYIDTKYRTYSMAGPLTSNRRKTYGKKWNWNKTRKRKMEFVIACSHTRSIRCYDFNVDVLEVLLIIYLSSHKYSTTASASKHIRRFVRKISIVQFSNAWIACVQFIYVSQLQTNIYDPKRQTNRTENHSSCRQSPAMMLMMMTVAVTGGVTEQM